MSDTTLDGTYDVQLDTPLGKKTGTLTLQTAGDSQLSGSLNVGGQSGTFSDAGFSGNQFTASGKQKVMFVTLDYKITGQVDGDAITATADTNMGQMSMTGTRA